MANTEHVKIMVQGVKVWNEWRKEHSQIKPDLSGMYLELKDLRKIDLKNANLHKTKLSCAKLSGADLSKANLNSADLDRADLSDAKLGGADLRGAIVLDVNLNGAKLSGTNLQYGNLYGSNFKGAILNHANLSQARLRGANLTRTNLVYADLSGADLEGVSLIHANLTDANLNGAILDRTDLRHANLIRTKLDGATFKQPTMYGTIFTDVWLHGVAGLDTTVHWGPSELSISTIQNAEGEIPEIFMRGCGLKDWEIEATKLYRIGLSSNQITDITYKIFELRSNPLIQFYSCFISHSSKDKEFAEKLYKDLQNSGVRCWFSPEHMKIGDRIRNTIDDSIRLHDKLLLILSETSVASQWVEQEVETALEKERERKIDVLFPIRLDDTVINERSGWPSLIKKTRYIGDFCQWKYPSDYRVALNRLLSDLRAKNQSG
jgi:uncharacterized protein YjbI with pentapeptide repeats